MIPTASFYFVWCHGLGIFLPRPWQDCANESEWLGTPQLLVALIGRLYFFTNNFLFNDVVLVIESYFSGKCL